MKRLRSDVDMCVHHSVAIVPTTTIRRGTHRARLVAAMFIAITASSISTDETGIFAILTNGGFQPDFRYCGAGILLEIHYHSANRPALCWTLT